MKVVGIKNPMGKINLPLPVIAYINYRELLRDYASAKNKFMKGRFSYRAFAIKVGFKSPNYIKLIVEGKRNLSPDGIYKLSQAMNLSAKEADFFISLVNFNQAKDPEERNFYFKKICSFKEFAKAHRLAKEQFEYFSKWYNVAVRELVNLPSFKMDPLWIAQKLAVTVPHQEIAQALSLLKKLGLIAERPDGRWCLTNPHLETESEVSSTFLMSFHREMILMAVAALKQEAEKRNISAMSMAVGDAEFHEIKKRLKKFLKEIQNYLASRKKGKIDRVVQLNCQLFHLTG